MTAPDPDRQEEYFLLDEPTGACRNAIEHWEKILENAEAEAIKHSRIAGEWAVKSREAKERIAQWRCALRTLEGQGGADSGS